MAQGAQCAENGPFFPPTSGYIIQNGISVSSDILKTPDWEIIFILLGTAFMAMVFMLLALVSVESMHWKLHCGSHVWKKSKQLINDINFINEIGPCNGSTSKRCLFLCRCCSGNMAGLRHHTCSHSIAWWPDCTTLMTTPVRVPQCAQPKNTTETCRPSPQGEVTAIRISVEYLMVRI